MTEQEPRALIAEARRRSSRKRIDAEAISSLDPVDTDEWDDAQCFESLADALEAAKAEIDSRIEDRDYWYRIATEARQVDEAAVMKVIDKAEKSTRTGSKPGRQRIVARAMIEFLGERHVPEPRVINPKESFVEIANRLLFKYDNDSNFGVREVAAQLEILFREREPVAPQPSESEAAAWDQGVATALNYAKRQEDGIILKLETFDGNAWENPYRAAAIREKGNEE